MKRLFLFLLIGTAVSAFADPMPDENAKKYLAELKKSSANYQRRTPKALFFSRAQLKYGLERDNYLLRWSDRPLMQDSNFARAGNFTVDNSGNFSAKGFINRESYKLESNLLKKFHLHGFAFFPETTGRRDIYNHAGSAGSGNIKLLPELFFQFSTFNAGQLEMRCAAAAEALKSPHTFRIDGKVVITSYPACSEKELHVWEKFRSELKKRHGEKFIIMPWLVLNHGIKPTGKDGRWSVADIKKMQERLRLYLRKVDGFYYNTPPFYNRRYQWEFDREVAIPIIHSVLIEPEFRGKYLAWGVKVGHMNCHHQSFGADAFCTDMLRGSVEAAVQAKADFINCVEWDEENENTCFRPMMNTGFSTLRLIRAYEELANNGGKFTMLDGDDPEIPNLILSYPRVLAAGQLIEFEIANIPDGTGRGRRRIVLELFDNNGRLIRKFPEKSLQDNGFDTLLFTVPSEDVLKYRFINPVLSVDGKRYDKGFMPIEVRTWWHWDYLYVKHVLRDMPQNITASLTLGERDENGLIAADVSVESDTPLRSVEIMTGDNTVACSYSPSMPEYFRETADRVGFRVSLQAAPKSELMLSGSITLHNVQGLKVSPRGAYTGSDTHWIFPKRIQNENFLHRYFTLPRSAVEKAEIEINQPLLAEKKRIKLADVVRLGSIGISGGYSANLVVSLNNLQAVMPPPVMQKKVKFRTYLRSDLPEAAFVLQTVDSRYRIFRTKKVTNWKPSGKMQKFHVFSMAENRRKSVEADADLLKSISWNFSAERGSVIPSSSGKRYNGILGGYVPLATGFGSGERAYGNNVRSVLTKQAVADTAPRQIRENGSDVLEFSGSHYLSLPMGMIPPYAGFKVEMEVFIDDVKPGLQVLLTDTRQAFTLLLNKGVPYVYIYRNQYAEIDGKQTFVNTSGIPLKLKSWNRITVYSNQQALWIEVNGIPGEMIASGGYHRYPRATSLGASERGEFFTGKIRNLSIAPW